ncbi:kunitz type trypsin inhibitor 104-like [Mercurialis annua]|uniref:kunitz type trypsin inhibitor 104-like n=1 Tax=Mercurialis annua TaxID=3986 RepID=UPI00215FFF64|nr:kunitz type trypsin inhibitor 104-like [Mercurialis annua]
MSKLILTLILTMAISTMAQTPAVLDSDGKPLRSGVKYYVLPAATDTAGGLTLINRTGSCYVGQEPLPTVATTGLPVIFTPLASGESLIREGMDLKVEFSGVKKCGKSGGWSIFEEDVKSSRRFIVSGGKTRDYFRVDKNGGLYNMGWCPNCGRTNCPRPRCGFVGILTEKYGIRLLALDGSAFPFRFKRV